MRKIISAAEMREIDRLTSEKYSIPSLLLMENAAHAAARIISEKLGGTVREKSVLILCGKGNNGGDGAALARILWTQGADVEVCLFGKVEDTKGDAHTNFEILKRISEKEGFELAQTDLAFEEIESLEDWLEYDSLNFHTDDPDVLVDAVFGTGLTRPLEELHQQAAEFIKAFAEEDGGTLIVALDVPSGLDADRSEVVGAHSCADATVTFTAPKLANVLPPAANFNGELYIANIGTPCELIENSPSQNFLAEACDAQDWLCKTYVRKNSYKNKRGTALIVAGSTQYSGAAALAANACFAAGAGMVTAAVPESVQPIVAGKVSDEVIVKNFKAAKIGAFDKSSAAEILKLAEKMNVCALGCGLASEEKSVKDFVKEIVTKRRTPLVVDADGLNALAPWKVRGSDEFPLVLTPHIGEFRRMLGTQEIENPLEAAREFAVKNNVILLLKGEKSLVAAPDGRVVVNPTGCGGISRAGAGDTLSGVITGFLAQTYAIEAASTENTFRTVVAALYISGVAGELAAEDLSQRLMTASDVRRYLGEAMRKCKF